MKNLKAVITADIVNSSLLGTREMNDLLMSIEKVFSAADIRSGFYRGDSFHALCDVNDALKMACLLRTLAIKSSEKKGKDRIDVRMTIGIGTIDVPVVELGTAKGEAFRLSGMEMERLGKSGPRLSIRCMNVLADTGLSAVSLFADFILGKMTLKQAEVLHELLKGLIQTETAKKLRKRQSTVSKHAGAGGWKELARLLEIYNDLVSRL